MSRHMAMCLFHTEIHKNPAATLMAVERVLGAHFFHDGFEFVNYGMDLQAAGLGERFWNLAIGEGKDIFLSTNICERT